MIEDLLNIPKASPERIITLRDSSFATDLFITAVGHLDFFNWLGEKTADIDTICNSLKIQERPADVMLTLFKAYGLVEECNGRFSLTDVSRAYLTNKSNFDLTSYVNSIKDRPVCEDIVRVMRTGQPANWSAAKTGQDWVKSMEDTDFAEEFTGAMNSRGAYLANGVVKALDLSGYHRLLDIGGASGIYAAVILAKYPNLRAGIFEKPPVDRIARYAIDRFGLSERMDVISGDMFHNELPAGYDVHFISHVLHDWDFNEVKTIISNSYRNLAPGGMIVVHEALINKDKTGPVSLAEYSVLLMLLAEGKCYSVIEMKDILEEAGFGNIEHRPTILNRSIITGEKI
jgi:predicted O-methyltransferase YrrM